MQVCSRLFRQHITVIDMISCPFEAFTVLGYREGSVSSLDRTTVCGGNDRDASAGAELLDELVNSNDRNVSDPCSAIQMAERQGYL